MTDSTTSADDRPEEASTAATTSDVTDAATGRHKRRISVFVQHKVLTAIAAVMLVIVGSAGGYAYWLNSQLGNIDRVEMGIQQPPEGTPPENERALNILLLGADNGDTQTPTVAEDLEDGEWTPFLHRSDTVMLVHIPADRDGVQLISIPRDTWVKIEGYPYDNGRGKLNAAFGYGGPSLARQTVEDLTGIRVDHMAVIDWKGFKDLTTALGGVRVYIPETFYDSSQRITWEQGWQELEGQPALQYVRTRYDIPGQKQGDYGRIARQQNFLRATMGELLASASGGNVIKIGNIVKVITSYLTVDSTWDNGEIRDLALSMRNLRSEDVEFLTIPNSCCSTSADGQSIIELKKKQSKELFDAIKADDIASYLEAHPQETLEGEKEIN